MRRKQTTGETGAAEGKGRSDLEPGPQQQSLFGEPAGPSDASEEQESKGLPPSRDDSSADEEDRVSDAASRVDDSRTDERPGESDALPHEERESARSSGVPPLDPMPPRPGEAATETAHGSRAKPVGPRRVFLGWDRPLLDLATEWLVDEAGGAGFGFGFGLPGTTVVVPGRRAGRLLLRRLSEMARERGHEAILPPEILTVGALPERILEISPGASEVTLRAAAAARLRQACRRPGKGDRFVAEALDTALGGRPELDDWLGWVQVAQRLDDVAARLEAAGLPVHRAARRVERMSGGTFAAPGGESERWQAWRELDQWLAHEMLEAGLPTRSRQRFEALDEGRLRDLGDLPERLVLVGLAELSPMVRDLLDSAYGDSGARADGGGVDSLIQAPWSERESFDSYGCPEPEAWSLATGPLVEALTEQQDSIGFVERPADQVGDALDWIGRMLAMDHGTSLAEDDETSGVRGPTVGVGDELSAERMLQGLAARGVVGHAPASQGLDCTEPGRCLVLLTRYSLHGGLEALMRCLAVPPIHRWVVEVLRSHDGQVSEETAAGGPEGRSGRWHSMLERGDLVAFVDAIGAKGVAGRPPQQLDPSARWALERVEASVRILVAPPDAYDAFNGDVTHLVEAVVDPDVEVDVTPHPSSVGAHARTLQLALSRLLSMPPDSAGSGPEDAVSPTADGATREAQAERERDESDSVASPRLVVEHWEQVIETLRDAEAATDTAPLRIDEAARTLLDTPNRAGEPRTDTDVEIVGWLELAFDPSHRVVVLDLNEGKVPSRAGADPALPESTLEALGSPGESARLARDAFLLTGLLRSREQIRLLACRRDESGEPLLPSRLLLAGSGVALAERMVEAFSDERAAADGVAVSSKRLWLEPARPIDEHASRFEPSRPPTDPAALDLYSQRLQRLRVTDFRLFLACPYRFFLRRVLGAEPARPWPLELDAPSFGNFVHEVLRRFGDSEAVEFDDPELVLAELRRLTNRLSLSMFGLDLPLSVAIQLEHLDRRLESFARWQASHRGAGWRTVRRLTERDVSLEVLIDGVSVEIVGRIDRVDRHPDLGYLLLDYKTGERPVEASDARGKKNREWKDLQLPLYRAIAGSRRDLFDPGVPVGTGLVRVSKQVGVRPLSVAPWTEDDYREALETCEELVREMRRGRFWPPSAPPRFADGLEWAAGDPLVGWRPEAWRSQEAVGLSPSSEARGR